MQKKFRTGRIGKQDRDDRNDHPDSDHIEHQGEKENLERLCVHTFSLQILVSASETRTEKTKTTTL
jgi:hypothetical protein